MITKKAVKIGQTELKTWKIVRWDTIYDLERALASAKRGYWGQCVERVEVARTSAYEWAKLAKK